MAKAVKTVQAPGTAVVSWEAEMEAQAKAAAAMEANTGGGTPRFSIRGGVLSIDDQQVPGNHMAVVILDSLLENAFYEGEFDSENRSPPTCFALGRDDTTLAPHEVVVAKGQAQNAKCQGCPMNAFGTSDRGRGKACKNRRRLLVIPAGDLDANGRFSDFPADEVEDHFKSVKPALLSVPPTSISGYATFVKQVAATMRLPPHGLYTKITVKPDPKKQVVVLFEPIKKVPAELMKTMLDKNKEVRPIIEQPYNLDIEEAPAKPAGRGAKGNVRPPVKKGAKY